MTRLRGIPSRRESVILVAAAIASCAIRTRAAQASFPHSLSFSTSWWRPVSDADSGGGG